MTVFDAKSYIDFVNSVLAKGFSGKSRGAVKALAERLKCHPTFVSQVLRRKAEFNHEQAARFCAYAQLREEETEFFLDLLNRDRAGSPESKKIFQGILDRKLLERRSLQARSHLKSGLSREQETVYFKTWYPPLVHAALQIPGLSSAERIARALQAELKPIQDALALLEGLGLVRFEKGKWQICRRSLHLGRDSPLGNSFHSNWRLKTAQMLQEGRRSMENTHFSSVFCISTQAAEKIREVLLQDLENIRKQMVEASSERLYAFSLDFYPLT